MRAADFLVRIGHLMEEHHRDFLEIIVYYFMGHDSCSSKLRSLVLMPFFLFSFSPLQMVIYYYWIWWITIQCTLNFSLIVLIKNLRTIKLICKIYLSSYFAYFLLWLVPCYNFAIQCYHLYLKSSKTSYKYLPVESIDNTVRVWQLKRFFRPWQIFMWLSFGSLMWNVVLTYDPICNK